MHDVGLVQHQRGHVVGADEGQRFLHAVALPQAPAVHFEAAEGEAHVLTLQLSSFHRPSGKTLQQEPVESESENKHGQDGEVRRRRR